MLSCTVTCPCQLQVFLWKTAGYWSPALFLTETAVTFTVSLYYHCFWQVQPSCLQSAYTNTVSDKYSLHVYSQPTLTLFLTGSCHVYRQPTRPLFLTETAIMFTDSLHYHCYWQASIMFTDCLHYQCYCLQSAYTGSDRQPSCLQSAYTTADRMTGIRKSERLLIQDKEGQGTTKAEF